METNQTQPSKPNSHMPMAIISTVLSVISCSIIPSTIFGIISIVYASKVNSKYAMQDYEGAVRASKNAKTWWIVTLVSIVVIWAISIFFIDSILGEEFMEEFMREYEREMEKANQ
ncbi:CD225/dispanin family protein [Psychroflexus montanilacus]|uniref:CD225/dispanin family protein n=1 Tax=Psychroflexus montanilacus TaxID=2873598 RepID=UPI001CCDDD16|nr:CD225/dispanin family protein [Psychroflexus montanilacus]MBZ9651161.1 CD225/dispanin family protein [Psychroflexus montanilacus]